jgi:hypothetical protein
MTTKLTLEQQNAVLNWPYINHIPMFECDSQGDIVLDCFMGLNHNRQFIGFEKDPEVFQIAKTRITTYSPCSKHQNLGMIGGVN